MAKAMRAAKAMKAMKRVSKIARGKFEVRCLPRHEGEDGGRHDEDRHREELLRKVREPEDEPPCEEELREYPEALDHCGPEGPEGAQLEGPGAGEREERARQGPLRQGEELLL